MTTTTHRLLRTEKVMTDDSRRALAAFVKVNPHYNGAHWADCLEVLVDSDSHLDITEPMYDLLSEVLSEEALSYLSMVCVTLHWSRTSFTPSTVRLWCNQLAVDLVGEA